MLKRHLYVLIGRHDGREPILLVLGGALPCVERIEEYAIEHIIRRGCAHAGYGAHLGRVVYLHVEVRVALREQLLAIPLVDRGDHLIHDDEALLLLRDEIELQFLDEFLLRQEVLVLLLLRVAQVAALLLEGSLLRRDFGELGLHICVLV